MDRLRPFASTPFSRCRCTWARSAARGSWVTITMVFLKSRLSVSSRARISSALFASRSPVGSSATSTLGSATIARAMATRCSWPPESWRG